MGKRARTSTIWKLRSAKIHLVCLAIVGACGAPATDRPARDVVFEPSFIDFDAVSITGQRTVSLSVTAHGDEFDITNVSTSSGKFRFMVPEEVLRGLADGETGVLQVQYRPCPEAWTDDAITPDFDFTKCSLRADEGRLRIVDSRYGWAGEVALLGRPSEPGILEIACTVGPDACSNPAGALSAPCESIDFGMVRKGDSCQAVIELRNVAEGAAAPIYIEDVRLRVAGSEKGEVFDGDAVGFEGLPAEAFAIAPNEIKRIELSFSPQISGQWQGRGQDDLGLLIFSNEPTEQPAISVDIIAMSSAPRLEIYPATVTIPRRSPGEREVNFVTLSNSGNEILNVSDLSLSDSSAALSIETSTPFSIEPGGSRQIEVVYSGSEHVFSSHIVVKSSDPNQSQMTIAVQIQPVPKLCLSPNPLLEITAEVGDVHLTNCGDGELEILEIQLLRSAASASFNSLGDFLVEGCPGGHCEPNILLCSDKDSGCSVSSTVFHVVYGNQDNSPFDLGNFSFVRTSQTTQSIS
jgi:hypothetical protein